MPVVALVVMRLGGFGGITIGLAHASLAGPVGVPLRMMLMPLWVAPIVTAICVDAVGSSGGLVLDSFAPFQNSAGPGSGTGVGNGPTMLCSASRGPTSLVPSKVGSIASTSTVYIPAGKPG